MAEPVKLLTFSGIKKPVALIGCDGLIPIMQEVLRGWDIREAAESCALAPDIIVRRTQAGYLRESPWLENASAFPDPVNAVCDFLVDLVKAYIADNFPLLCLHTAAVDINGGLVLFPGTYKAGKSTLSVHCAASGLRVFADDVLPVDGASKVGIAPGILPRLRLPLHDGASPRFKDFLARHEGPLSDRFQYVDLNAEDLAPLGTAAPIVAIVLLERMQAGESAMTAINGSEALVRVIRQNFSRNMPALDILDLLNDIVTEVACFELRYRTGEEAVDLLRQNICRGT